MPGARDVAGRRYALALMDIARQHGTIDRWVDVVDTLAAMTSDPAYVAALQGDGMTDDRFEAILRQVLPDIAPVELNLFRLLRRKHRLALGPSIASYFRELRDEERHIVRAAVTTAVPLDEERVVAIRDAIARRTGGTVELEAHVDESLIGGMMLRIGDQLVDGSTRTRLRQMRQLLAEGGPLTRGAARAAS